MIHSKEARFEARESLKGNWGKAIGISVIDTLISVVSEVIINFIFSIIAGELGTLLATICNLLITIPLTYGITDSFYKMKNGQQVELFDFITVGFKNFKRSIGVALRIFTKVWYYILIPFAILIILLIVGLVFTAVGNIAEVNEIDRLTPMYVSPYDDSDYSFGNRNSSYTIDDEMNVSSIQTAATAVMGMGIIVFVVAIVYIVIAIFFIKKMYLYALAYYVAVAKPNIDPKSAVEESAELMMGNRGRLFGIQLSYFGWFVVLYIGAMICSVIPFIGFILIIVFVVGGASALNVYINFGTLAFYRDLVGGSMPQNFNNIGGQNGQVNYQQNGGFVAGGYNQNPGMQNNGYQINQNPGMQNNGYQINQNPGMQNNGYQVNQNPGMQNNGYQVNQNPGMQNNGYQVNQNPGMQNNGYQVNQNPGMQNNGYQVNQNPGMQNNGYQVNQNEGIQNNGAMPQVKYCKRCGAENAENSEYCVNCGARLD